MALPGLLGRITPPDFKHVETYPLDHLDAEARPTHVPVCPGTNWYTDMDEPVRGTDGIWRIPEKLKGTVRGGHCYALEPAPDPMQPNREQDVEANWVLFDQGQEGACEGFGHGRALTIRYGRLFDCFWIYDDGRRVEGAYPNGEGTTNRSVLNALRKWGAHYTSDPGVRTAWSGHAPGKYPLVATYRWATTAQQVLEALGVTGEEVTILNSWGKSYPHRVQLPASVLERLLHEEGECDVITDR